MSKLYENESGILVSHENYINNVYKSMNGDPNVYRLNPGLFNIFSPYKKSKSKRKSEHSECEIETNFYKFIRDQNVQDFLDNCENETNQTAIEVADNIQKNLPKDILDLIGGNKGPSTSRSINESKYLFPENSSFFSKDVNEIEKHLTGKKFDFILLDPPWWNKYIRRKRKASSDAYQMMYNYDLKNLPVEQLLKKDGLIAVWCTNSEQNYNALLTDIFPHWKVNFVSKWYWMKITKKGEPICNFSDPPGKQPFERIIFAHRTRSEPLPENGKLIVSIPSAIHSHKPPLAEVLQQYLPNDPECLEVFARYLVPGWTSYGNEAIKLQHESLFVPHQK
ncbi:unnamed protein product [Phyllotreta striolata]|uniref:Methyltransferase-like protein 4 n=1 Tax=Phyllotreta striolata TaxID=444603 RepID=A0A9N9TS83_PHYSR|nr:unnamed protein product [Phyllotreta striolata]